MNTLKIGLVYVVWMSCCENTRVEPDVDIRRHVDIRVDPAMLTYILASVCFGRGWKLEVESVKTIH